MLQFIWLIAIIWIVLYILYHVVMYTIYRIKLTRAIINEYWYYSELNEALFLESLAEIEHNILKATLEELNKEINNK